MRLPEDVLGEIRAHAEAAYPEECCGLVLANMDSLDEPTRVRRCRNAQDRFHELDPESFPRTSRNAYFIDPQDLLAVERERVERNETVRVIYHSHPDVDAYFSDEDQRRATMKGEPVFPDVSYLVISVVNRRAVGIRVFKWDGANRSFAAIE
jgi:proteasome lid subunit RPN8/RPN11